MGFRPISLICLALPIAAWANEPDVLVNSQGLAQRDLSIRGSAYSGAGISINGMNLRVPWAAHYHTELPIAGKLLSVPATQTGLNNASGHLIGTRAYQTLPLAVRAEAAVGIGTKEHYTASFLGSTENIAGYIDWEKAREIDYSENGLERSSGAAVIQFEEAGWMFDIISAGQSKEFDAQGYYGLPRSVYAEQEIEDTLLMISASKGDLDGSYMRATAGYRELNDEYEIPSALFSSEVKSRHFGMAVEGRTIEVQNFALNLRGDLDHERVSDDLDKHRTRGSVMILPEARYDRIAFKAGFNSVFQTSESPDLLPMAGIDWFASDNSIVYASYTETEQQPDYQMRYYNDGLYRIGNKALKQQHAHNAELGYRQFLSASLDWRIAGFFRRLENAADWTQAADGDPWTATDLGDLNMGGIETAITYKPSEKLAVQAFYQWLDKESADAYAGLYELDHPEHMLNLSAYWKFLEECAVEYAQTMRYQTSNNARSGNDFGANASLGLHYHPRYAKNVRLSFLVENLWGTNFEPIPGLKARPTTVFAGMAVQW